MDQLWASEWIIPVFECYLDDSGTSGLPVITMAGFVGHNDDWKAVEAHLNATMDAYKVPVFHAKEFHDTKEYFEGWSRIKKQSFCRELLGDVRGKLTALSITIRKKTFETHKATTGEFQNMSVYGLCFSNIVMKILMDPKMGPEVRKQGLSFLVEAGNENNSGIEQSFRTAATHNVLEGSLRSIEFVAKGSSRAIQLADFWAFYSRRHMRDFDRFDGKVTLPMSFYLENFHRHFQVWQYGLSNFKIQRLAKFGETTTFSELLDVAQSAARNK